MSKGIWWVVAGAAFLWVVAKDEPTKRPVQAYREIPYAPQYSTGAGVGLSAPEVANPSDAPRAPFGTDGIGVSQFPVYPSGDVDRAKREFEEAADDLRRSVRGLQINDWDSQMGVINRRLRGADDALSDLERLRPGDSSLSEARDNLDRMRRDMRRLHDENWRDVAPDLYRRSGLIQEDASRIAAEPE
jgi:hypothetical protein